MKCSLSDPTQTYNNFEKTYLFGNIIVSGYWSLF